MVVGYIIYLFSLYYFFFFFNDTATTEIYTLSLHDALPISRDRAARRLAPLACPSSPTRAATPEENWCAVCSRTDRKSTRLNSSHSQISYAVFCLKKKKNEYREPPAHISHHAMQEVSCLD